MKAQAVYPCLAQCFDLTKNVEYLEEYVLRLQAKMQETNDRVRENFQNASLKQGKYYNNQLNYHEYKRRDQVYYYYPIKYKNSAKECFYKWRGPNTVVKKLSHRLFSFIFNI